MPSGVADLRVDEGGRNRPVAEVIADEIDLFACVEYVDCSRVPQDVNMATIGRKSRLGRVEVEERRAVLLCARLTAARPIGQLFG